ncbi:tyrosine-type recombinase/integrase [Natrinema thermotolerans]|uniref:tyrosine-type recombinase/integrase n=1 Tax=Natrinema thermotolerans TaxID=121872 RepID=UPI00308467B0
MTIVPERNSEVTTDSRGRDPNTPTVKDAVMEYRDSLDSGGSQSVMKYPLAEFAEYCADELGVDRVGELGPMDLRDYGQHLKSISGPTESTRLSASTANTYYDYVRAFLGFCVRSQWLESNPANTYEATEHLPEDKGDRRKQFWSADQRDRLLEYADERVRMARDEVIDVPLERAYRDRTVAIVLARTGVRGAEIFRDPHDEYRDGLRWGDVDLEDKELTVLGKSRSYETAVLPTTARDALERLERVCDPPTDEWPVFPTAHAASKYSAVETVTGERPEPGSDIDAILRDKEIAPPSITKEAGRQIMKQLTKEAGIELEGDHEYLEPHGARRALGTDFYVEDAELAQDVLRHQSIETTHEYLDRDSDEMADEMDRIIDSE